MTLRTAAAVAAGKLARAGLQTFGRGATALPGLITLAVDPDAIARMTAGLTRGAVLVTNLFRDQLDRYHEVDQLARRIATAFAGLGEGTVVVLNADDPIVARLAEGRANTIFFGIDDPTVGGRVPQSISDATHCPRC